MLHGVQHWRSTATCAAALWSSVKERLIEHTVNNAFMSKQCYWTVSTLNLQVCIGIRSAAKWWLFQH